MKKFSLRRYSVIFICFLSTLFLVYSCNKNNPYETIIAPTMAEFTTSSSVLTFGIGNATATSNYIIPIGLTSASGSATPVKVSISSPTGAVQGTQYNVSSTDITIPAGKVLDSSLVISANYATYQSGRIDTLVLTISGGDANYVLDSAKTKIKLVLRRSCALAISDYVGDFVVVQDAWEDYSAGDVITLTNVDATHFSFKNVHAISPVAISVTVNTSTNAVSIAKQTIGTFWNYTNSSNYPSPFMSATGSIEACDKVINLTVTYGYSSTTWSGTYLLQLKKK
ncbi:MAG: hypothetical protein DI598_00395 [Pseudopedobacter saltans]|uniref:Uncharacterized protein n=1 Tax=Pseudopedobacter saltans TaxID=151895 RepID=A0A2W5F966_9SPHI|nr:MAG: hypothetical protein DI598_00395 [Pseudopedobacter saltans]